VNFLFSEVAFPEMCEVCRRATLLKMQPTDRCPPQTTDDLYQQRTKMESKWLETLTTICQINPISFESNNKKQTYILHIFSFYFSSNVLSDT
jgi:hypothetical protein